MPVLELTKELVACPSVTPVDAGCQAILAARLEKWGFQLETHHFGEVTNLWARRGEEAPLFVFAGHTDVVPTGPESAWTSAPFEPSEREGVLYGRGVVDMKGGLAAMVIAVERFLQTNSQFKGSLAFLLTSDEEGPSIDGTKKVIEVLKKRGEKIDYCIIGEPSSEQELADQIRVGRRGSLHGTLGIRGQQGHIAYALSGQNPIHNALPALQALTNTVWDEGNEVFPPTSFQISNFHAGIGALNVIPGELELRFNFRFSTAVTVLELQERVESVLKKHKLDYHLEWNLSGEPFQTKQGKLISAAEEVISTLKGYSPKLSTGGGTSDGRFIAPTGAEVIELGLCHKTAHQVDECASIEDLENLAQIYQAILKKLLGPSCCTPS